MNALLPERTTQSCDICGAVEARELYTATDRLRNSDRQFSISKCEGCGIVRTLPDMSEQDLDLYYPSDYWGGDVSSQDWIRKSQAEKVRFVTACGLSGGRILDVGCGAGFFLRALPDSKWDRIGVETGKAASEAAARWLGGERVFAGDLTAAGFSSSSFDVITFWSSLEHMNAPRANLEEARRIVKQGGTVIVQVPNIGSYQAKSFKGDWFALDVPRHRYHFDARTLTWILAGTGFEVYTARVYSREHNSHALRQSLKKRLCGKGSRLGYGAFVMAVPFIKPFDYLMTLLGGGATLTVAAR